MSKLTDSDLVARTLAGSQAAFGELVERYQRPVYGLIVRMVRNPAVAEELAQEAFLRAYTRLATFERERRFSSWLFKVAHNATIDHLRRRRLNTLPLEVPEEDGLQLADVLAGPESENPESRAVRGALSRALEEAMAELRDEYREILLLRFRYGLSYSELAEVMGLALGTVKTHLHRARLRLARSLEDSDWDPGK